MRGGDCGGLESVYPLKGVNCSPALVNFVMLNMGEVFPDVLFLKKRPEIFVFIQYHPIFLVIFERGGEASICCCTY